MGNLERALRLIEEAIGAEFIETDPEVLGQYSINMLPIDNILPVAVVKPGSVEEVREILKIANQHRIPLWPVSGGQNHGYGMACAVNPGNIVVDLRRMNKIVEVDQELAYALVEPGVTFLQLYKYLKENNIPLWLDCPSGSPESSIVGNIVERGVGYTPMGEHFLFSCGMEVVLPNGEIIRTGTGTLPNTKTWQVFKWGYGPYLDGLFTSSNFGIVTKVGIWLMPIPPAYEPLAITLENRNEIHNVIDILRTLKLSQVIPNGACLTHVRKALGLTAIWGESKNILPKVGRRFDFADDGILEELKRAYNLGEWNFAGALYGLSETVKIYKQIVEKAFSSITGCRFLDSSEQSQSPYWRAREKVMRGEPLTEFDASDWVGKAGSMWISPVAPVRREDVTQQIDIAEQTFQKYGFNYSAELILGSGRDLHHIIWLMFDRANAEEKGRAYQCAKEMLDRYCEVGYLPYRTSVAFMKHLMGKLEPFNEICHALKRLLDPNGILAPGKSGIDIS